MAPDSINKSLSPLLGVLFILATAFIFTPILKAGLPVLGLGFCLLALALSQIGNKYYKANKLLVLTLCTYLSLCLIYWALGISSIAPGALALHLFFFICILLLVMLPRRVVQSGTWVFLAIVFIIVFNVVDNIRLCIQHPELYVLVNRDMDPTGATLNIGSSKFYNAICFFNMVCFFGFLNSREMKVRIIFLLSVLLSCVFLFAFCLKASVIIFTVFSMVLIFFAKRTKDPRRFLLRILFPVLIAYAVVSIFSDEIIGLLSSLFSSPRLVARLSLLIDPDSAEAARGAGTLTARENLWLMSIETWVDNIGSFVFGIGDHRANWSAGQSAADTGIGQHSDFLDSFARYGIIGVSLLISILIMSFKRLLAIFDKEYSLQIYMIILVFIMFGFTKVVFQPDIGFLLFIFLPMISKYINARGTTIKLKSSSQL